MTSRTNLATEVKKSAEHSTLFEAQSEYSNIASKKALKATELEENYKHWIK